MKTSRRIYKEEAELIGETPKPNEPNRKNARYSITNEQYQEILAFRLSKKTRELKEVIVKKDKNGNVTSTVEKLQSTPIESVPDGYEIVKISTSKSTGQQWIQSKPIEKDNSIKDFNYEEIKSILQKDIKNTLKIKYVKPKKRKEGILKWADLHLGAYIRNVINTDNYDSKILKRNLLKSVAEINELCFSKVHVHFHGDLIESFSGLNHINSWHSMEKNMFGANVIKACVTILDIALSNINNLGEIKIVAGNHDRTSKNNDEDVKGGAADLIAFCLSLKGYKVDFNPMVLTHLVNGVNYVILHGDKGLSKLSTSDIILNYGKQGVYNYICEAHLHSIIEELTVKQKENFKLVKVDSIDRRREHLTSFMPGNFYSSSNGWSTNTGYQINWATDRGRPMVLKASF